MVARSLTLRAVLALVLLLAFYGLGLFVGLSLIGAAIWMLSRKGGEVHVGGVIGLLTAGGGVLLALVPRFARFVPPGPAVDEHDQPRLFALTRQVATEMGQPMPRYVYLMPEVNAFVAQVGGFLGLGGRRVLALGLGLLAVENVSQVKATIAHEFGHFAGSDTKLGSLTYATRSVMIRVVLSLSRHADLLAKPFDWLFRLYLRITQSISRQQELVADEWSVRLAGKTAHVSGLHQVSLSSQLFNLFLEHEVLPLAARGLTPKNSYEGFRRFSTSTACSKFTPAFQQGLAAERGDPFDSHPALSERIDWAHSLHWADLPMDRTPARSLLEGAEALEEKLSGQLSGAGLEALEWDQIGAALAPALEQTAARLQARVEGMSLQLALDVLAQPSRRDAFVQAFNPGLIEWKLPDRAAQVEENLVDALEAYFGVLLAARGFSWQAAPGELLQLEKDGVSLALRALIPDVLQGKKSIDVLTGPIERAGLQRGATILVTDEDRDDLLAPRCEIKLEQTSRCVVIRAPLAVMVLPQCCGVCRGAVSEVVRLPVEAGIGDERRVAYLDVPLCSEHLDRVGNVLSIRSYRPAIDEVCFEVKDPTYVELICAVNA